MLAKDDKPDTKQKIKADVTFLGSELTLNAVPCMGNKAGTHVKRNGLSERDSNMVLTRR